MGRRARLQLRGKGEELGRVFSGVDRHRRHVSGKLAVDFSEDLHVAERHLRAGVFECIERGVDLGDDPAERRVGLEESLAQQHPVEGGDRGQEPRPAPETAVLRRTWLSMAAIRATSDT